MSYISLPPSPGLNYHRRNMEEKVNILLVDDHPANLDTLEAILDNPDYHFVRAMSGREALKHLLEFRDFAVILLDVQMPEMDGFEMARLIKKRESSRSIPIIFLTAISKEESYVFEGYAAGAVDYLIKPFSAAILKSKVAVFVELFRKDRELQELSEALRATLQSEIKHRTVADFTYNWEYWISPEGKFLYISPSFKRITGYESDMLIRDAQDLASIVHPEDRPAFQTHLEAEIVDSLVIHHFEFRISRPEGGVRWINHSCQPINDTEGHFLGRRASNEDVTDRKQAEESLKEALIDLRRSTDTLARTLAATVEVRDPYTAGHQKRVAELAGRLAAEMAIPEEMATGMVMACGIHDIGKISIPAEILSKPSRLSKIEIDIIRTHPEIAYQILKDIPFPWPVAQMVYQHHERLNGTGYPRGMKGEEILPETRIMAVADVVEAMASHRPYRPALGIDAALQEIEEKRGILYDPEVVDACLRLFREKGYRWEG